MIDQKLYTLIAICETGNFTRAAQRLSLTQPAVSGHIKQLEGDLGIKIFNRAGNELKLTVDGEIALKYARRMIALQDDLLRRIDESKRMITQLTIGVTHTSESNFVLETLARYGGNHSEIKITIITDSIDNLYEKLGNFQLDLAIVEGSRNARRINTLLLDTDYLVLATANDHPLAKRKIATLDDVRQEKMILRLPGAGTRNLFVANLESQNMSIDDFNVILEVDNIAAIKDLVRLGYGVSILPRSVCLDEIKRGTITVLPIENLSMTRETNMIYPTDFRHPEILSEITRIYGETAKLHK